MRFKKTQDALLASIDAGEQQTDGGGCKSFDMEGANRACHGTAG